MPRTPAPKLRHRKGRIIAVTSLALAVIAFAGPVRLRGNHRKVNVARDIARAAKARVSRNFVAQPLGFEANVGQTDRDAKYVARGRGYKLYLAKSDAVIAVQRGRLDSEVARMMQDRRLGAAGTKKMLQRRKQHSHGENSVAVSMHLVGASSQVQLTASELQPGKVNYLVGSDPAKWRSNIPLYGRVEYRDLYPGVDLVFRGAESQLEFDYLIDPGASPKQIGLRFDGAQGLHTTAHGDLVLSTPAGSLQLRKPVAYQQDVRGRQFVDARFVVQNSIVGFEIGNYDHTRQLTIDPTVTYSTYFGGDFADYGVSIAVDGSGNSFVAGATDSDFLPGNTGGTDNGSFDVFVSEISAAGILQYTTIFGGSGDDFPGGIAIDGQGIYISGTTDSSDFPVTNGAAQTAFQGGAANGNNDAFAVKLSLDGTALDWGTYIAGNDSDSGLAIAIDSEHNVYVVGETYSTNLPVKDAMTGGGSINLGKSSGDDDGYIAVINSAGSGYNMLSYLGGSSGDIATGVALDGSGNAYVSGITLSTDLPVTSGVFQSSLKTSGVDDAFVLAIKAANLSAANTSEALPATAGNTWSRKQLRGYSAFAACLSFTGLAFVVCITLTCGDSRRKSILGLLLAAAVFTLLAMPACGGGGSSGGGGGGGGGGGVVAGECPIFMEHTWEAARRMPPTPSLPMRAGTHSWLDTRNQLTFR